MVRRGRNREIDDDDPGLRKDYQIYNLQGGDQNDGSARSRSNSADSRGSQARQIQQNYKQELLKDELQQQRKYKKFRVQNQPQELDQNKYEDWKKIRDRLKRRRNLRRRALLFTRYPQKVIEFCYPDRKLMENTKWKTRKEIARYLKQNQPQQFNQFTYFKKKKGNKYKYELRCRKETCKAKIIFRVNEFNQLQLVYLQNLHTHSLIAHRRRPKRSVLSVDEIVRGKQGMHPSDYVMAYQNPLDNELLLYFSKRYKASIIKLRQKVRQQLAKNTQRELQIALKNQASTHNCYFYKNEKDQKQGTTLILMVSEKMKLLYSSFGQLVFVQVINDQLFDRQNQFQRPWKCGFLMGIDNNLRPCLFGFFLISLWCKETFVQLFRVFFEDMVDLRVGVLRRYPDTIVTEENNDLSRAIQELKPKYEWTHLYNFRHEIQKIKKRLFIKKIYTRREVETLFKCYLKLLKQTWPKKISLALRRIKRKSKQLDLFEKFMAKRKRYLPIQIGPYFIGCQEFSQLSYKIKNIFHSQIQVTKHKNYFQIINDFIKLERQLIQPMFAPSWAPQASIPDYKEMRALHKSIQGRIFQQLVTNFTKTAHFNCFMLDETLCQVTQNSHIALSQYEKKQLLRNYTQIDKLDASNRNDFIREDRIYLVYSDQNQCWECPCMYRQQFGLPCMHLLKIIRKTGDNIRVYIDIRWYRNKQLINDLIRLELQDPNNKLKKKKIVKQEIKK